MSLPLKGCLDCNSQNFVKLNMYKRYWILCTDCGTATPIPKKHYFFGLLPGPFKKNARDEQSMYDYFVSDGHIKHSQQDAKAFLKQYVETNLLSINNKDILDVSGGNGEFLNLLKNEGAKVTLTEINNLALVHAKEKLGLDTLEFNFDKHTIRDVVKKKFDIILLRACLMFCNDLETFAKDLHKITKEKGEICVQYAVKPTIGTLLRTQCDEFSYAVLRQPEQIVTIFEKAGFSLEYIQEESDQTNYVYDHDEYLTLLALHYLYEIPSVLKLRKVGKLGKLGKFNFNARDRRRSNMIFKKN